MKTNKPVIGILPSVSDNDNIGDIRLAYTYFNAVKEAGGLPVMLSFTEDYNDFDKFAEICDGFLFSGGVDIDPKLFGEEKLNDTIEICPARDNTELKLIHFLLDKKKPIFAICRGIQVLNVALGGTLYQDIPSQLSDSKINHRMQGLDMKGGHYVKIKQNCSLSGCFDGDKALVNTYHHQAIKDLAEGLEVFAIADDDIIEGVYLKDNPSVFGVQWHPEKLFDDNCQKMFEYFIKQCKIVVD